MSLINPNGGLSGENSQMAAERAQMQAFARIIKQAEDLVCECGGKNFINVYRIKKVSGLLTGTGKDTIMPISVYACANCGLIPDELENKLRNDEIGQDNSDKL
jgi:hypothetical protein